MDEQSSCDMQATKHHPKSVDLELVKQLIQKTKYTKLQQFLCKEFDAINAEYAGEILTHEIGIAQQVLRGSDRLLASRQGAEHCLMCSQTLSLTLSNFWLLSSRAPHRGDAEWCWA